MKIIIGGAQRSGTSFLRSIVGFHPAVAVFPYDLRLWTKYWPQLGPAPLNRGEQDGLIHDIVGGEKSTIADDLPNPEEIKKLFYSDESVPITAMDVFDSFLKAYAEKRGRSIWGHKTPWNEFHAKEILDKWGDAFFLHLVRNPLRSAASAKHADGGTWFYDPFLHIDRWRESANLAIENQRLYPGRYVVIRYEDLRAEPRQVTQSLCKSLGLEYQEGIERGLSQPGWDGNNSSFGRGGGVPAESGKNHLAGYLERFYRRELWQQMEVFGYIGVPDIRRFGLFDSLAVGFHRLWLGCIYRAVRVKKLSLGWPREGRSPQKQLYITRESTCGIREAGRNRKEGSGAEAPELRFYNVLNW